MDCSFHPHTGVYHSCVEWRELTGCTVKVSSGKGVVRESAADQVVFPMTAPGKTACTVLYVPAAMVPVWFQENPCAAPRL